MAHQSLYRRYRPRRFGEVRGQDHVVRALQNAVRTNTQGHAYLFSGPRGTGKTSTARILAKALNCEDLRDGEPCCECSACLEMEAGRSFDLFELDAASNNGVDNIRELVERAAVGSPGRTKVYILDEVHMLTPAASNALLKTLEEPPEHVVFVLATTDPQKVLPTIRSRTQHYEFQLLSAKELSDYVHWIAQDAPLDLAEESVAYVVRQGKGSARDTLSALDQVVAAGGVITREAPVDRLLRALADHDSGAAVLAVSDALAQGHDPRVLADGLLNELRDTFLLSLGVELPHLVDADAQRLGEWATTLGTPALTRAMEAVGAAMVDMRQAADPRVPLDVALVRLCTGAGAAAGASSSASASAPSNPAADDSVVAQLVRRIDALERALADGASSAASNGGAPARRPAAEAAAPAAPARQRPEPVEQPGPAPDPSASAPADGASAGSATTVSVSTSATGADGPSRARAALGAVRAGKGEAATRPAAEQPAARNAPAAPGPPPASPAPRSPSPSTQAADPTPAAPPASAPPAPVAAEPTGPAPDAASAPAPASGAGGTGPDPSALTSAMADVVLPQLKGLARAIFSGGKFVAVTDAGAVFTMENAATIERAERFRTDVQGALSSHFGVPVTLVLVDGTDRNAVEQATAGARTSPGPSAPGAAVGRSVEPSPDPTAPSGADRSVDASPASSPAPSLSSEPAQRTPRQPTQSEQSQPSRDLPDDLAAGADDTPDDDESSIIDVHALEDADVAATGVEKLTKAFPGAVLVDGAEGSS
ncbi:MAG TPA: DNA polymerase III subunit gamma/tau [Microthrixaceae bacterium]|nr:DNA polymerase III subunit gamma/tau [Microthrixaceae bacterium]